MMHNIRKIFYFFVFIITLCKSITFAAPYYDPRKLYDKTSSSVVMITNKIKNGALLDEGFLNYGSLVHARIVLTLTEIIAKKQPDELQVYADCYSDWYIFPKSCNNIIDVSRFRIITEDDPNNASTESKYSLIYLKRAVTLNTRLNIAIISTNDDAVDKSSCLIFSYAHHFNTKTDLYSSFVTPLKAFEVNGSIVVKLFRNQLMDNNGLVLNWERTSLEVDFFGSPIMCLLKNSTDYVQVAISNLTLIFLLAPRPTATYKYSQYNALSSNFAPKDVEKIWSYIQSVNQFSYSVINVL